MEYPQPDPAPATNQNENQNQNQNQIINPPPRPAPTVLYTCTEYNPNISILYIRSHEHANHELAKLGSGPQTLGFDLEWKPNFRKGAPENPVALVQLSNHDTIFLLQISAMKEFPSQLALVLASPSIVKAGVAIQSDAKKLYYDCQIPMYNCVDLSLLARTVDNARWKGKYNNPLGLARLTETYEYRLLPKGKTTRSNWEANLDARQIEYASNDAHAGYVLYKKLESMISLLQDPPKTVWYSFNLVSGQLLDSDGHSWHAHNPNYDPGPPPPPKPPKAPKEPKETDSVEADGSQKFDSNTSKKNRQIPHIRLGRHDIEKRPRNTSPSHPYVTAYQEQVRISESSSIITASTGHISGPQGMPHRNRRHQPRRTASHVDHDFQNVTSTSTQTSQTQPNGALSKTVSHISSAQRTQQVSTHLNRKTCGK